MNDNNNNLKENNHQKRENTASRCASEVCKSGAQKQTWHMLLKKDSCVLSLASTS